MVLDLQLAIVVRTGSFQLIAITQRFIIPDTLPLGEGGVDSSGRLRLTILIPLLATGQMSVARAGDIVVIKDGGGSVAIAYCQRTSAGRHLAGQRKSWLRLGPVPVPPQLLIHIENP